MNTQILLWSMIILPYLSLLFMKKEDAKRYMPVGIFAALTSILIGDIGVTFGIWVHQQTAYPLNSIMPFDIGLNLALTMWIFKYAYGQFGKYFLVNFILDIGFNFFFFGKFLPSKNILHVVGGSPLQLLTVTLLHAVLLYIYQIWQEGVFAHSRNSSYSPDLHPAAAKPLPKSRNNREGDE